jgi:hypothetical protein
MVVESLYPTVTNRLVAPGAFCTVSTSEKVAVPAATIGPAPWFGLPGPSACVLVPTDRDPYEAFAEADPFNAPPPRSVPEAEHEAGLELDEQPVNPV